MPPVRQQAAQKQHYVPKFILRNFLSNQAKEQVSVFTKSTGKGFTVPIASIMAERRFHDFRIDEDYMASFEGGITHIENLLLPTYRAVVERGALDNTPEEKANLIALMAFQFVRTRAQRDLFLSMEDQLKTKLEAWGAKLEDVEDYEPMTEETNKLHHLKFIEESTSASIESLIDKDLLLLKAPEGRSFYLSDNPVAMYNSEPKKSFIGNLGFSVPGIQIYLPLSAELMLCVWCPSIMGKIKETHRQQQNDLAGAMLSPRMMHLSEPEKMKAYIDKLRPLTKIVQDRIRHADNGTPSPLTAENMDFQNSLQVANASEHVICKQGDFALANQFMKENPHHKGFQMTVG